MEEIHHIHKNYLISYDPITIADDNILNNPLKYTDTSGYYREGHEGDWWYLPKGADFDYFAPQIGPFEQIMLSSFNRWANSPGKDINIYDSEYGIQFNNNINFGNEVTGFEIGGVRWFHSADLNYVAVSIVHFGDEWTAGDLEILEFILNDYLEHFPQNEFKFIFSEEGQKANSSSVINYNEQYAKVVEKLEGKPYVYGADGLIAYDCSGTACYGIRTVANSNFSDYTAHDLFIKFSVSSNSLLRGSVIFYDFTSNGRIDHVTTILNSTEILHPSSGAEVLQIKPINYLDSYTNKRLGTIYFREFNWQLIINNQ